MTIAGMKELLLPEFLVLLAERQICRSALQVRKCTMPIGSALADLCQLGDATASLLPVEITS